MLAPSRRRLTQTQPGLSELLNPPTTVARRIRRRGEHGISRKAITQGMPGASAEPVCSCAHPLSPLRTRPRGAARTRHSLRPLFWADGSCKARAPRAAGTRSRGLSQTDQTLRHFWDAANAKSKYREQMPRERRRRGKLSTHRGGEKGRSDMMQARRPLAIPVFCRAHIKHI